MSLVSERMGEWVRTTWLYSGQFGGRRTGVIDGEYGRTLTKFVHTRETQQRRGTVANSAKRIKSPSRVHSTSRVPNHHLTVGR